MGEGGVRTFLTLGPAGLAFEVESAIDHFSRIDMAPIVKAFERVKDAACALGDGLIEWGTMAELANAGNLVRSRRKRPGQWTDRTRAKRARRLEKARARADHEWTRRAWGRQQAVLGGRRGERAFAEWIGAL